MKLHASLVNDPPRQAIQRINLSDNGALANAPEARIAGTCAQVVHLGRHQRRPRTGSRSSSACLGAGMATAYDDDIKCSIFVGNN
jgi:hypothetical protein